MKYEYKRVQLSDDTTRDKLASEGYRAVPIVGLCRGDTYFLMEREVGNEYGVRSFIQRSESEDRDRRSA